jgi:translation initiation factor 3 subunit L
VVVLPASTSDAVLLPLPIPSPSPSPALLSHSACALSRASLPRAAAMAYDGGRDYGGGYDDSYDDRPEFRDGFRDLQPPEPGFDAATYVPDVVKTFVVYLYRHIREKNVYEIHQMYEGSFQKLSDRLFKQSNWPHVDMIAPYVENDHVFCLLYKEMWFRHVYARLQPTLEQRCDSWDNYCNLFQVILHGNVNMQLPNQWLWDMVDEFIYQFQSFCQYRAKLKQKTEHELAVLRQIDEVWNVVGVLNYLQALIEKSMILQILEEEKEGNVTFTATDGYDYHGGTNVLKVLGYFSIVGLLRVHCLLGDYHSGLRALSPIDINQPGVFNTVIGCQITTIYYYGFANLMLRRYMDAIKSFNQVLLYIFKTKQYHQRSSQYDQILKKNEQMYALLAICLSLCPHPKLVEENVNNQLREKYAEKMLRMQRSDEAMFDELFSYACPKFITPSPPNYDEPLVNFNQDAYRLQLKLFLSEVRQQQLLSSIRSFLKLYTTISIAKLASFMDVDEPTLRVALLTYKHKTHVINNDGSVLSNADVDFYIDDDMVHIADTKVTKRFGDYFIRHIQKFDEVNNELDRAQLE